MNIEDAKSIQQQMNNILNQQAETIAMAPASKVRIRWWERMAIWWMRRFRSPKRPANATFHWPAACSCPLCVPEKLRTLPPGAVIPISSEDFHRIARGKSDFSLQIVPLNSPATDGHLPGISRAEEERIEDTTE